MKKIVLASLFIACTSSMGAQAASSSETAAAKPVQQGVYRGTVRTRGDAKAFRLELNVKSVSDDGRFSGTGESYRESRSCRKFPFTGAATGDTVTIDAKTDVTAGCERQFELKPRSGARLVGEVHGPGGTADVRLTKVEVRRGER